MRWTIYILLLLLCVQCREPYKSFPRTDGNGLLVVEGIINANGKTKISLSRTTRLNDQRVAPETLAMILIEGENNTGTFPLFERSSGFYESEQNSLDATVKYRLKIVTKDSREYVTNFSSILSTPAFQSVSWNQSAGGVDVFAQSVNDNTASPYYKWEYEETWEYNSAYRALIGFREKDPDSLGNRFTLDWLMPDQSVDNRLFTCYGNEASTNINLVTTEALSSNVVFYPVRSIPRSSIRLSLLYSIVVKQYALSRDGYHFFSKMKRNTEALGSLFDAQPSDLVGNVVCTTDPSELVIGYVETAFIAEQRIFIANAQLEDWGYETGCKAFVEPDANFSAYPYPNDPALFNSIVARNLMPTVPGQTFGSSILSFYVEQAGCVDCKLQGGLPVKPAFWP